MFSPEAVTFVSSFLNTEIIIIKMCIRDRIGEGDINRLETAKEAGIRQPPLLIRGSADVVFPAKEKQSYI